ncbi:MAG: hypothetical protein R3A13_00050 [Bdellovibrionota bacterium]
MSQPAFSQVPEGSEEYMSEKAMDYYKRKANESKQRENKARDRINKMQNSDGSINARGEHKYHGGVLKIEHFLNGCTDLVRTLSEDFLTCLDLQYRGFCIKIGGSPQPPPLFTISVPGPNNDIHFRIRWAYHFAAEVGEVTRIKGISRFADSAANSAFIPLSEELDYELTAALVKQHLGKVTEVSRDYLKKKNPDSTFEIPSSYNADDDFIKEQVKRIKEGLIEQGIKEEEFLRVSGSKGIDTNKEYHVIGGWASTVLTNYYANEPSDFVTGVCPPLLAGKGGALPGLWRLVGGPPPNIFAPCHKYPPIWTVPYMSEYMAPASPVASGMTPYNLSRLLMLTEKLTASGPHRNYEDNMKDFYKNPLGCMQDNRDLGLEVAKIFPGLVTEQYSGGKGGCYSDERINNPGVSMYSKQADKYEASTAESTALRAMHVSHDMFPTLFCNFDMKRDKIQWFLPETMPKGCYNIGYQGDRSEMKKSRQAWENNNLEEEDGEDLRNDFMSFYKWREMKACCPEGWLPQTPSVCMDPL